MSENSKIEWTDTTWNPTTGCTKVTPGCDNCYAERIVERFHGKGSFAVVTRSEPKLWAPFKWRKPRKVFVNSMSDLFHDQVPDNFIVQVFSVMARTPQHTYQLLTKRHGRMRSLLSRPAFQNAVSSLAPEAAWPLRNLWLGVSVEDQKRADLRIPALLDTPAWIRWLSCEPLLGPVDIDTADGGASCDGGIDWVVVGGESGHGSRPMHPEWARSLRDQCTSSDIPFFFKQWGEWAPMAPLDREGRFVFSGGHSLADDGTLYEPGALAWPDGPRVGEALRADHNRAHLTAMYRVGKKAAPGTSFRPLPAVSPHPSQQDRSDCRG